MPTKEQYDYFMFLYEHERSRYVELINRGKLFLTIVTLYFGVLAIAIDKSVDVTSFSTPQKISYFFSFLFLVISLFLIVRSISVYANRRPSNPAALARKLNGKQRKEMVFRAYRIAELATSASRYSENNNKRALLLKKASTFLALSIVSQFIYFLLNLI